MFNTKLTCVAMVLVTAGMFGFTPRAYAYTCTALIPTTTLTIPDMVVTRDTAIGSVIGTAVSTGTLSTYQCTNEAPVLTFQSYGVKGYGTSSTAINGRNVYLLGPASTGIGYTVQMESNSACVSVKNYYLVSGSNIGYACHVNGMFPNQPIQGSLGFTFYKVANVTSSSVPAQSLASFILQNDKSVYQSPEALIQSTAFKIRSYGCTLSNTAITVPMGTVNSSKFSSSSYGATMPEIYFSIPLACDVGTAVKLQIDPGASGTVDYRNGVLMLDPSTSGTAATGVALQILRNGSPLTTGAKISIGTPSATGVFDIVLSARYFRSAATVTAGQASASATFTLIYN